MQGKLLFLFMFGLICRDVVASEDLNDERALQLVRGTSRTNTPAGHFMRLYFANVACKDCLECNPDERARLIAHYDFFNNSQSEFHSIELALIKESNLNRKKVNKIGREKRLAELLNIKS